MLRPLIALLCLLLLPTVALAQDSAFETRASHAVIMDYDSGAILFSKNGDEPMPPSSMSKLMTALMVFEALESGQLSLDDELPVSEDAWRRGGAASGGSTMFLPLNSRVSVSDLLRGIIVQSGNDACIVVAEALGGTEANFADMMTARAHELGLGSTNFVNATGWPDDGHVISAIDLARLAAHIIREFPQYYPIYSETEFTFGGIRQYNRNPLLGVFQGADGLKTGHTSVAGYGLTATAVRDGTRRIVVFNGMDSIRSRGDEAERLMRASFSEFAVYDLVSPDGELAEADVYLGVAPRIGVRAVDAVSVGLHRRDRPAVRAEVVYDGPLVAPITAGDVVGRLVITIPGGRVEEVPLVATADVARQGMFGRAASALVHLIRGS